MQLITEELSKGSRLHLGWRDYGWLYPARLHVLIVHADVYSVEVSHGLCLVTILESSDQQRFCQTLVPLRTMQSTPMPTMRMTILTKTLRINSHISPRLFIKTSSVSVSPLFFFGGGGHQHRSYHSKPATLHRPSPPTPSTIIDLRSDTVSRPSLAMRDAMKTARVGDDVFGEDPTVNLLEQTAARMTGKQAALFVATGTMSNLLAIVSHAPEFGSEMIVGDRQHTYLHEQGGSASLGGVHSRTVPNLADGSLDIQSVLRCLRSDDAHYARVKLVSVENTHNDCGGVPLRLDYLDNLKAALDKASMGAVALHMDGARAGNAAVALGVSLERVCRAADSVSICLSKGMGAPVGSILCGSKPLIERARRSRKAVGGGWRQAGVLAACGLIALESFPETLRRDHLLAQRLAAGLEKIPGIFVEAKPATNMVYFETENDDGFIERLSREGVLMFGGRGERRVRNRAVVHCDVSEQDIDQAIERIQRAS